MDQKIWSINGIELELDISDADGMERYETAFEIMAEEEKNIPKEGKRSAQIRGYCKLFRDLFANIFGEESADMIFKGVPVSCEAYDEIYVSFLDFVREQSVRSAAKRAEIITKYTPNRQQKRLLKK